MNAQVWVSLASAVIAAIAAIVAWRQGREARQSAAVAEQQAAHAIEAAEKIALAHERLAVAAEADNERASAEQANQVCVQIFREPQGRGRVRITNSSDRSIFDVQISRMSALLDGAATPFRFRPNPFTTPVVRDITEIPGRAYREFLPMLDEVPEDVMWCAIVTFRDANRVLWELNSSGERGQVAE